MQLLKQDTKFSWDNIAQESFDAMKHALTNTSLIHPPNYHQDYLLYLAAADNTIAMVLVQEDKSHEDHVIYYLSRGLTPTTMNYSHVE